MTSQRRTTLATVAESAGVSVATVSKVLNGRADVAPATRARVQEMLRAHDYAGRLISIERHPTVELTFRGRIGGYSAEIVQGVAGTAAELGVAVTIGVKKLGERPITKALATAWARDLAVNGRRAVIAVTDELGGDEIAALRRMRLPLVVVDPMNIPTDDVVSVGSTNFRGGQEAARHLIGLGHRRIAYLGGRISAECSQARLGGFRAALDAAGIGLPDERALSTEDFHYENGLAGAPQLLSLADRPTAIFAASDELARGAIEAARSMGISVPHDLSIVGFDDTEIARIASPPLTTVRQPLQEMGAVALRTALRLLTGDKIDSNHVELATELVVRASTAPPSR
ncbi:MAG: LacI family DNA-binding transcriptional regulator [Marmoricola sp.]|nr:LacI family DNA-binding transcriptional regulator [Marmoricola sp.]